MMGFFNLLKRSINEAIEFFFLLLSKLCLQCKQRDSSPSQYQHLDEMFTWKHAQISAEAMRQCVFIQCE